MTEKELERQRVRRKLNGNITTHKYEKTPSGFLMRLYRNMQSRVDGVQKLKYHLYEGKYLLDRNEFYDWAKSNTTFWELFNKWTESGYERRLTPSVDRINSDLGYIITNMEFVTHSENSRRGSISQKRKYKITV